jgi:hypothetical protein
MSLQSAKNVTVAFKQESAFNTPPGAGGAEVLRFTPSAGLQLQSATIRSNEQRADALQTMGRNGSEQVTGTYTAEASVGSHDTLYEAVMRATWQAPLTITEATSGAPDEITTEANAIVGANGSWIAAGLRVGDVIRLSGHSTAANNDRNLRVAALTATRIETIETLTPNAVADTTYTIVRGKKLANPAAPVKRTFYVDQRNVDIDGSQLFGGVRWTGLKITGTPDGMAELEFTALGASMTVATGGDSPYFTSPTVYNSVPLVFADARIGLNGTDITVATAFELTYTINAATQPVVGSKVSPDVFDNDVTMSGSFSMIREDFDRVQAFRDETEFALHILLTEPVPEPKPYLSFYVPRCKYTGADAPLGGDGAMIESLPFQTGAQTAAAGVDATMLTICTSAAP